MNLIKPRWSHLLWLALLPFAGCGDSGSDIGVSSVGGEDLTGMSCVEGRTTPCRCGDEKGARLCDEGIWTACLCATSSDNNGAANGMVNGGEDECGDGEATGEEMCDGDDLAGETCSSATMGMMPDGELSCSGNCALDTSECTGSGGSGGMGEGGMFGGGGMTGGGGMFGGGGTTGGGGFGF